MQAYFVFRCCGIFGNLVSPSKKGEAGVVYTTKILLKVIFAIVLAIVAEISGHAVHLLHAVRPIPEYPRDVGNFKDKFHSVDAVRPDDNHLPNARLLKESLNVQHVNPSVSHIQNGIGIAYNPLFMRDKRSELKKKKRQEKNKTKKTKAGKNKGAEDDKESDGGNEKAGGGKKGKKN